MYQQNKSCESKVKFRHASNNYERILEAAKFTYVNKAKNSSCGSWDFRQIADSVLNKGKSAISPLSPLSSIPDRAKLFSKFFSQKSYLDDSGIYLPVFSSRTNLKLRNISVTFRMAKKVIMSFHLPKESGPYCIPVMVLRNSEPDFSYIIAELFNVCLKGSCFPDCWKVSMGVLVFKDIGDRFTGRNYRPVSLLFVVSKVLAKHVNNRLVDHLEKCGLFCDFQYGFRYSGSTADLLTVVSDRIARILKRFGATGAVVLDIYLRLWQDLTCCSSSCWNFRSDVWPYLFCLSKRQLWLVLDGKLSKEYSVNAGVPQGFIIGHTPFLLYTNDLSMMMILLSTTLNKSWLLNLNLICQTLWIGAGSGLLISMLEKLNLFLLTGLTTLVLLMWKWMDLF